MVQTDRHTEILLFLPLFAAIGTAVAAAGATVAGDTECGGVSIVADLAAFLEFSISRSRSRSSLKIFLLVLNYPPPPPELYQKQYLCFFIGFLH